MRLRTGISATTASALRTALLGLIAIAIGTSTGSARHKPDFAKGYKNKYFVVLRNGLALGICSENAGDESNMRVEVTDSGVSIPGSELLGGLADCASWPEHIRKGEVLSSSHAAVRGKWLIIWVAAVSPHAVTRGAGAFQHQSYETPAGRLMFSLRGGEAHAADLLGQWLEVFDTKEEAAKFGNTASGVFVKEVKLGMTFAEVESVLGVPQTRVDLGPKVLYKYKDMTVVFKDGKVADVH